MAIRTVTCLAPHDQKQQNRSFGSRPRVVPWLTCVVVTKAHRNKAIVLEVLTKSFTDRDFTALEQWLSPDYIQHNPTIPGTREGLLAFLGKYPEGRRYEAGLMIAEDNLVFAHGRYSGGGKKTLIAADIFRFEGDLIVEHWDVLQEEIITETVGGNPMFTAGE